MATKNTNQVKAVADKLVPQGKPLNSVAQGPVSKDAVTVADLAWLSVAQSHQCIEQLKKWLARVEVPHE